MCGIYGVLSLDGALRQDSGVLSRMGAAMVHRGPDDHGSFIEPPMLLGMRRLSIIDVAGGHQPLRNEDGSVVTVCNGEIYNFRELRSELEAAGHRLTTHSDCEVVAHLYEEHGEAFLQRLEGMFALALWDRPRRRLILARDPLGIKPLYYRLGDGEIAFASEAKSLFQVPGIEPQLDQDSLTQYLAFGYVCAPRSLFAGVRKLPRGTALLAQDGRVKEWSYRQRPAQVDTAPTEEQWVESIRAEIERSVRAQMVSDVPIGA